MFEDEALKGDFSGVFGLFGLDALQGHQLHIEEELACFGNILFEGAQGFYLDIDWGDYPYVTSSHCTVGSAIMNGVSPQKIRKIYGVAKIYETYVGLKKFEPENQIFSEIRKLGNEFGATTGRPRQCNWLNLDNLVKATRINGVTDLIINKMDILRQLNVWHVYYDKKDHNLGSENIMKEFINEKLGHLVNVCWSDNPNQILQQNEHSHT